MRCLHIGLMIWALLLVSADGFAGPQGPQVLKVDDRISISADNITLANLMRLWDVATGMRTTVPRELANRRLTVRFSGVSVDNALQRIFEGTSLGSFQIGSRVVVREALPAKTMTPAEPSREPPDSTAPDVPQEPEPTRLEVVRQKPEPPKYLPTPFGPIPAPTGNRYFMQLPPVYSAPPPPFFRPEMPPRPPAGAPNGPQENMLFGPVSVRQ